ncbi:hypothetical protein FEI15_07755 [Lacticaseibacillus zeae]|uniref:Uncharacterized protein n=1 Tax=Lacticaseibacillus zeae TaxID=57037 RepID=A0A5R8LQ84_LACZE|nr:hypothetical protein FEI15_07755 [Lacticaseibacillus zeae]
MFGFLCCLKTRSQAQKPACKDLRPKWLGFGHLGLSPLTLRFLTGPVHALRVGSCFLARNRLE